MENKYDLTDAVGDIILNQRKKKNTKIKLIKWFIVVLIIFCLMVLLVEKVAA